MAATGKDLIAYNSDWITTCKEFAKIIHFVNVFTG